MELDFRKKSRCDRIMCSNSFETQGVREIGRKEAGESRGFSILWMGIKRRSLQNRRKRNAKSGKIENV